MWREWFRSLKKIRRNNKNLHWAKSYCGSPIGETKTNFRLVTILPTIHQSWLLMAIWLSLRSGPAPSSSTGKLFCLLLRKQMSPQSWKTERNSTKMRQRTNTWKSFGMIFQSWGKNKYQSTLPSKSKKCFEAGLIEIWSKKEKGKTMNLTYSSNKVSRLGQGSIGTRGSLKK